jgi:hypothetical protein
MSSRLRLKRIGRSHPLARLLGAPTDAYSWKMRSGYNKAYVALQP